MKKEQKEIVSSDRKCGDLRDADFVVGGFARKILGKKAFIEADVVSNWAEIAGENLAEFTKPVRIDFKRDERKGGVLHIEAANGASALEAELKSKMIIAKVNTYFGYEAIDRIKIMQNLKIMKKMVLGSDNFEKKLVSIEQENYIKEQTGKITTSELRDAVEKLGYSILGNIKKEQE